MRSSWSRDLHPRTSVLRRGGGAGDSEKVKREADSDEKRDTDDRRMQKS